MAIAEGVLRGPTDPAAQSKRHCPLLCRGRLPSVDRFPEAELTELPAPCRQLCVVSYCTNVVESVASLL